MYESLGIREGRHAVMFESVPEFIELVLNYTTRPDYEQRRLAIVRRAQAMALRKFTWDHVAEAVERAIHEAMRASPAGARSRSAWPPSNDAASGSAAAGRAHTAPVRTSRALWANASSARRAINIGGFEMLGGAAGR